MVVFTEAQRILRNVLAQSPSDTISTDWNFKGNHIILFYSGVNNNQDIFYLQITTPHDVVYIPFFMLDSTVLANETIVRAYIANEIYLVLRGVAFNNTPEELLENVVEHLNSIDLNTGFHHVGIIDREQARGEATVHVINEEDRIYLKTIRNSNMGKNMPRRIRALYPNAEPIIDCLRQHHKTLVFSDDYRDSRDIYVVLRNEGIHI